MRAPGADGSPSGVLVAHTLGAPAPARRRLRRARPQEADPEATPEVPLTVLTVISAEPLEEEAGEAWLGRVREDDELRDELVDGALGVVIRALAARRVASADPSLPDATLEGVLAARIGYGSGDELVDGRYEAALELPRETPRTGRYAALRPQERFAALLGGRELPLLCEELLVRARADLDGGRVREAALQIRVGLEALLAERTALSAPGQEEDLAALDARRTITGEAANEALQGTLSPARTAEVTETISICARVLRRQAAHG